MPHDDLLDFGDLAEMIIGGWRYLLSRKYRLKKHREWQNDGWVWITLEIILGVFGVLVSLWLLNLVVFSMLK
ncbi:hypothetical protein [Prosthecobacter sp.]|uniref:hypothetical protein n=1 Tax=Prosthecobacter sp. TaxID=1965333 RepID=UPI002489CC12|nr:hypothetical protein [Prosthecobacter sp.]MDI1310620.1 hypothetical protein [Prosthecobacter sp.]